MHCRLILETDPATIANQVAMRGSEDTSMSLTEQVKPIALLCLKLLMVEMLHLLTAACAR